MRTPSTIEEALSDEHNRGWLLAPVYPVWQRGGDIAINLADLSFFYDEDMNRWSIIVALLGFGFVIGYCRGASRTQIALREMMAIARARASLAEHDPDCPNHPDNSDTPPHPPRVH